MPAKADSDLIIKTHARVDELTAAAWNQLNTSGYPFMRHEYLAALERHRCAHPQTGWSPCHLSLQAAGQLLAVMPLYRKTNSFGEFVFDFAWANTYDRHGLAYYPKLVNAIPFTPVPGPRILCADPATLAQAGLTLAQAQQRLIAQATELAQAQRLSSIHRLYVDGAHEPAPAPGYLPRKGCQFQWRNRNYGDFEDFLARFSSAKRKKARRERQKVQEAGIRIEQRCGQDLDTASWRLIFPLYASTFLAHGHEPYMNQPFFEEIARTMGEQMRVMLAYHGSRLIACAITFQDDDTLYGRYWGALADYDSLHFELCYYQGIAYCIEQGLRLFDPGTQGEHKLARGFEPTPVWSQHWIADRRFRRAIAEFLVQENAWVDAYMAEMAGHSPYKQTDAATP